MENIKVLAGIVTYNPEFGRFLENITELRKQVGSIVVFDNGSNNIEDVIERIPLEVKESIHFILHKKNAGIAEALSSIMNYAREEKIDWVLTLDQDSVIEPGLVSAYCKVLHKKEVKDIAMLTCLIKDRNFVDEKYEVQNVDLLDVPFCITSAAFTSVEKYFLTDGYDSSFFIDCVDFDLCYTLRESGYRIARINYVGLVHEVGKGENRRFLWKKIVVYHHKPFRIYYLSRNTVLLNIKHKKLFSRVKMMKTLIALWVRIALYETDKKKKMGQFWRGIRTAREVG